jgi:hypothetical protein
MTPSDYKYDIAFSFLAQDEPLATEINDLLQDRLKTFLYSKQQGEIAGTDGEEGFGKVFGEEARIVVVLYRVGWGQTPWTRIEETAIRNRSYDHGYDFAFFILLDDLPSVPKWLPKTQIWFDLKRWGVTGAAAAIETRVQERGGAPHEETVKERATRLQRALDFAKKRKQFLNSPQGVEIAYKEFEALYSEVDRLINEIKITTPAIALQLKRSGHQVVLLGFTLGLNIIWKRLYSNTLDNAELHIELWSGHPPFPGIMNILLFEEPHKMDTITFQFDLLPSGEYRWNATSIGGRSLSTKDLAAFVLNYFMDEGQKKQTRK